MRFSRVEDASLTYSRVRESGSFIFDGKRTKSRQKYQTLELFEVEIMMAVETKLTGGCMCGAVRYETIG